MDRNGKYSTLYRVHPVIPRTKGACIIEKASLNRMNNVAHR